MKFNFSQYSQMLDDNNISVLYSGPIWASGIEGLAEMMQHRLNYNDASFKSSQCVFSVFVEQMNNMLMYSAEKECYEHPSGKKSEASKGIFILGIHDNSYFIQTRNMIANSGIEALKQRIDFINAMDKKELRQHYKERVKIDNNNPESKGAGLGLIEIARRSSSKIEYTFTPYNDDLSYFSLYVTI